MYPVCSAISNLASCLDQHSVVEQAKLWLETESKKGESYLWYTGVSHYAYVGKSIPWAMIGCQSVSEGISVYVQAAI